MTESLDLIQNELAHIKQILATIVGVADRSVEHPFSEEVLNKIAKDFLKLSTERGDWVRDDDIKKFVKTAPYNPGQWLRKEFAFTNCYKHGHAYYYSKKDLIAFNEELVKHNIDLNQYKEMLEDKRSFERSMEKRGADGKIIKKEKVKGYIFPKGVKDIVTSDPPKPDPEIVKADLLRLKEAFKTNNYAAYVDLYKCHHAMMKRDYTFYKYREDALIKGARRWCEQFNYANNALKAITGKHEKFVAPPDENAIEL